LFWIGINLSFKGKIQAKDMKVLGSMHGGTVSARIRNNFF
jgi:hypothetical protein